MKKFEILKAVVDFAESCEANGVQLFFDYAPHCDFVRVYVYKNGKYTVLDSEIEYIEKIFFGDEPFEKLKEIINQVIDKYYPI